MLEAPVSAGQADESLREAACYALTAATLLLRAPDARIRAQAQAADAASGQPLEALRQSYYDRFCIPQSGLYIPPFEHVFRRREKLGNRWHFPPARFDGGRAVEAVYARFGFLRVRLDADPILRAPHLPGDHLGFMLAFVGWALQGAERDPAMRPEFVSRLEEFLATHFDGWVEAYCGLLQESEPRGYAAAVGGAVSEAVTKLRQTLTDT